MNSAGNAAADGFSMYHTCSHVLLDVHAFMFPLRGLSDMNEVAVKPEVIRSSGNGTFGTHINMEEGSIRPNGTSSGS